MQHGSDPQIRASSPNFFPQCEWRRDACIVFSLKRFWTARPVHSEEIHAKQCWAQRQQISQGTWEEIKVKGTPWMLQTAKIAWPLRTSFCFSLPETKFLVFYYLPECISLLPRDQSATRQEREFFLNRKQTEVTGLLSISNKHFSFPQCDVIWIQNFQNCQLFQQT